MPFGPPPEEYLYRCQVCGTEDLVNEVIIDVVVGGAKFRGEYRGGMPKLECPKCCRETMEYVDQEPESARRGAIRWSKGGDNFRVDREWRFPS